MRRFTRRTKAPRRKTRRSHKGRRAPRSRMMAKVAKRVALSLSETKRYGILNERYTLPDTTGTASGVFAYRNIFVPLSQGYQSYSLIGSEMIPRILALNIRCYVDYSFNSQYNSAGQGIFPVRFHVWIIASNEQFVATSPTKYDTSTTGPGWMYQPSFLTPRLNSNNCKVLKYWSRIINPPSVIQGAGTSTCSGLVCKTGKLRWRPGRKITYEDSGSGPTSGGPPSTAVTRGWNYYILGGWSAPATAGGTAKLYPPGQMDIDSYLYYKDP